MATTLNSPAIVQFLEQAGSLSRNDKVALIAVLGVHQYMFLTGLEDNLWQNVEYAIGDGVETSMETEEDDAPLTVMLNLLEKIAPHHIPGLLAHLSSGFHWQKEQS